MSTDGNWERALEIAFEAYHAATQAGAENERAVDVALAKARAIVPELTEGEVRQGLAIRLAEYRAAERSARPPRAGRNVAL